MQNLTIRDLRYDFGKVDAWLADGEDSETAVDRLAQHLLSLRPLSNANQL